MANSRSSLGVPGGAVSGLTEARRERDCAAVGWVGVMVCFLISGGEIPGVAARRVVMVVDFGDEDGPAGARGTCVVIVMVLMGESGFAASFGAGFGAILIAAGGPSFSLFGPGVS